MDSLGSIAYYRPETTSFFDAESLGWASTLATGKFVNVIKGFWIASYLATCRSLRFVSPMKWNSFSNQIGIVTPRFLVHSSAFHRFVYLLRLPQDLSLCGE